MTARRREINEPGTLAPPPARPYRVVIDNGQRPGLWGAYRTAESAERIAAALRRHGMLARVIEPEPEREMQ